MIKDSKDERPESKASANAADIDPDMIARLEALGYMGSGDSTPEVLNNRANIAFREGNYTEAKIALDELLAVDSDNQNALKSLVKVLIKLDSMDEAIATAKRIKAGAGDNEGSLLGSLLMEAGKVKEAEAYFVTLWKKSPSYSAAFSVGSALQAQKQFKEALGWFIKAHKLKPEAAQALNNAGHCAYQMGDEKSAAKYFEEAAKASSSHVESRYNLANLALKSKDYKKSERWFREALKAKYDFRRARQGLIRLLMATKRWPAAEQELAIALEANPKQREAWTLRAKVAEQMGRVEQAKKYRSEAKKVAQ